MGTVIGTCGCKLTDEEFKISYSWKDSTREGKPAISYGSLCNKCSERYRKHNLLIKKFHVEKGEVQDYSKKKL